MIIWQTILKSAFVEGFTCQEEARLSLAEPGFCGRWIAVRGPYRQGLVGRFRPSVVRATERCCDVLQGSFWFGGLASSFRAWMHSHQIE